MKTMEIGQLSIFIIALIFISSVSSNECRLQQTCGECIQFNGTCGWCLSPDYAGMTRCELRDLLIKDGCPEDEVLQSVNSAHLQKSRKAMKKRLLQPQKVTLQLVPNTGYVLPVKAFLVAKNNDQRLGGEIILSVKAPKHVKVTMKSDCNNNHPKPIETSSCHGVHNGQTATFSFTILTESCFSKKKTIYVRANNMKKPQLVISIKAKCGCDCERKKSMTNDIRHCHGNGKLVCGQCECDSGIFGRNCECAKDSKADERKCMRPDNNVVCSGNGQCICGTCRCSPDALGNYRYSGRYCSCDSMGCPKFNGSFCGGPKRGLCNCGQCGCLENYQGRACEMEHNSEKCMGSNGKICSGNGICEQNLCHCDQPFFGNTCEEFNEEPILTKYCREGESSPVCSNRGTCIRGACKCNQAGYLKNQTFTGRYCECDDYRCERYDGEVCGGFERGTCNCGKCRCRDGFSGSDCSVSFATDRCRSSNGRICGNHGHCVSNRCQCSHGYGGQTCDEYGVSRRNLTQYCIESGKTEVCSNHGDCIQGMCVCKRSPHGKGNDYTGRYCECDDYSCEKYNGKICGGKERGTCFCGACRCLLRFSGSDCSLTGDSDKCIASDRTICNNNGDCVNNHCECQEGYQGRTCEDRANVRDEYTPYCVARNSTEICSNQGTCVRGRCHCIKTPSAKNGKFTGRYCECDDFSCERVNGELCGGEKHGQCVCGKCVCRKQYSGPSCSNNPHVDRCTSRNGKICNNHGVCINNECKCEDVYTGKTCDEYDQLLYSHTKRCRKSANAPVCSDRGNCIDGYCQCHTRVRGTEQRYTGEYCECDDYNCDYYNGQLCGGPERGICNCGRCACREGFLGSDCSGSNSTEGCRASNGQLCMGRGTCESNKCRCEENYRGPTCEECPTCPGVCARLKPCVLCRVFGTGSYTFEKCIKCEPIVLVDSIEKMPANRDAQFCLFLDKFDSCRVRFSVERGSAGQLRVTALTKKECPAL